MTTIRRVIRPEQIRELSLMVIIVLAVVFFGSQIEGYLSARLVEEVLKKLGPRPERKRLAAAAESLEDIALGIDQKASFAPGKRQALGGVYYTVVEKGEFVPLRDWSRWKP